MDGEDWFDIREVFIAPIVPPVEREIALSLKFELVSCSLDILDVINAVDCRDKMWFVRSDEILLIRASSSLISGEDDKIGDELKRLDVGVLVVAFDSIFTGFDFVVVINNLDGVESVMEVSAPVDSGKLLAYCIQRKKKKK